MFRRPEDARNGSSGDFSRACETPRLPERQILLLSRQMNSERLHVWCLGLTHTHRVPLGPACIKSLLVQFPHGFLAKRGSSDTTVQVCPLVWGSRAPLSQLRQEEGLQTLVACGMDRSKQDPTPLHFGT